MRDVFGQNHKQVVEWIHEKLCTDAQRATIQINSQSGHPEYQWKIYQRCYLEWLGKTRFAWCWFQSSKESALMWNTYGQQGVAVATTVGNLKSALGKSKRRFKFGKMNYTEMSPSLSVSPFDPAENRDLLLQPHFLKREEYKSESEVRFVTAGPEKSGIVIDVSPNWIELIRLHPKFTQNDEESLKMAVKKLLPNIPCSKSDLLDCGQDKPIPCKELAIELEKAEESKWTEGSDGIPQVVKEI